MQLGLNYDALRFRSSDSAQGQRHTVPLPPGKALAGPPDNHTLVDNSHVPAEQQLYNKYGEAMATVTTQPVDPA